MTLLSESGDMRNEVLLPKGYEMTITPQPWIPVSERLPEEGVEVWVVAVGPSGKALFHAAAMWRMTPSGRMEWEDEDCVIHHPTHWMNLPSPPEVK